MDPFVFSDAQKVDIRRFCGYPPYGNGAAGFQSWRYFSAYGVLEYRLNNLSQAEGCVVIQYLDTIQHLEAAIAGSSENLDTQQAAVWTHNPREVRDRTALYLQWCRKLCAAVGAPLGPDFPGRRATQVVI